MMATGVKVGWTEDMAAPTGECIRHLKRLGQVISLSLMLSILHLKLIKAIFNFNLK